MFHNILVLVDGSPDAEQALTEAIDLAESEHTHLTVITAVTQLPSTRVRDGRRGGWKAARRRACGGSSDPPARTRTRPRRCQRDRGVE